MKHQWFAASGGGLVANLWTANALKVCLLKPTYVIDSDNQKLYTDISAQEVTGTGYTAGGLTLASKTVVYDPATDRTNLICNDSVWGPGATFDCAYAAIYDSGGTKPLWSIVNFEETKSVSNGSFTIDWASVGTLYVVPV